MPSRRDLDLAHMVAFLPNVVLVDVLRDPLDFRYRVIGTAIENHSAGRHTGKRVSEIPERAPPSAVWDNMAAVAESGQPSDRSVPYVGPLKDFTNTRQITLPLSDNAKEVDKLLLVIEYYRDLPKRPRQDTTEEASRAAGSGRRVRPTDNLDGGRHCEAR